jgi:ADP-ribosylglycohydrolase
MTGDKSAQGCLLGLAVGDAVGTTVEFSQRGTFALVTDMVGGGPFRLKPGEWTDDTRWRRVSEKIRRLRVGLFLPRPGD